MTLTNEALAAAVLNDICTRDELESILRSRKIGLYGRLRKEEMAQVVAGHNASELLNTERKRQLDYRARRRHNKTRNQTTTHD
jgi:hypothetical protein